MAGYFIANYDVTDPVAYQAYTAAVRATLDGSGVEVLVADYNAQPMEGQPGKISVVLKFASKAAALVWYNSPAYQAIVHHRLLNTEGSAILVEGFAPPA